MSKRKTRPPSPPATAQELKRIRHEVRRYLDSHTVFEWWEKDDELLDQEDYLAVLELRRGILQRQPEDAQTYLHLADAYALLGDYDHAVRVAGVLHRSVPQNFECQELILELLFAQGADENDFDWVERPSLIYLDESTKERCHRLLVRQGTCSTFEILSQHFHSEYCCFDEEELAAFLAQDPRFEVDQDGHETFVRLNGEDP